MIAEIYMKKLVSSGMDVINAKTGKEVLKYASEQKFDLILLDMVLPEMSGMDVLKELKLSGNYDHNVRVVVFSNLSETETRQEAVKYGADGFIGKSQFSPSELVKEVDRILKEFAEKDKNVKRLNGETMVTSASDKKKILLIEDEEIFLDMFGKKLEDEGYAVTYANNGAWGLKEALEKDYDIIITDMMMPALGGEDIVKRLKTEDRTKNIPIVVISASVDDIIRTKIEEMGVSNFFLKTQIVPSDLSRKVAELIG